MQQSISNGNAYAYSGCKIMKSRNNFVTVLTSVHYSRNNYILLPEDNHTCMC